MDILAEALSRFGVTPTPARRGAFDRYRDLLRKWSRVHNLTAITDEREIVVRHFIDSLAYLAAIPAGARTLLDIGTGAGFPGVPLGIARPGIGVFLVEPSGKKAAFLRNLVTELGLANVRVVPCRVEDYPCGLSGLPGGFDVVVTRALWDVGEFVRKAEPLCAPSGVMIVSKGPAYEGELAGAGGRELAVVRPDLSAFGLERYLIVVSPRTPR